MNDLELARIVSLFVVLEDQTLRDIIDNIDHYLRRSDVPDAQREVLMGWRRMAGAELRKMD